MSSSQDSRTSNTIASSSQAPCCRQEQVAFMAGLTQNFQGNNQQIPFDNVVTNNGGAYRSATGCFIVPAAGVYVFHVHILRCRSSGALYVHLMRNGDMICSATNQDTRFETTSMTAVLTLQRGDVVWVRLRQGIAYGHSPSHYSTFTGYSLQLSETIDTALAISQARYSVGAKYSLYKEPSGRLTPEAAAAFRSRGARGNMMSMMGGGND